MRDDDIPTFPSASHPTISQSTSIVKSLRRLDAFIFPFIANLSTPLSRTDMSLLLETRAKETRGKFMECESSSESRGSEVQKSNDDIALVIKGVRLYQYIKNSPTFGLTSICIFVGPPKYLQLRRGSRARVKSLRVLDRHKF